MLFVTLGKIIEDYVNLHKKEIIEVYFENNLLSFARHDNLKCTVQDLEKLSIYAAKLISDVDIGGLIPVFELTNKNGILSVELTLHDQ